MSFSFVFNFNKIKPYIYPFFLHALSILKALKNLKLGMKWLDRSQRHLSSRLSKYGSRSSQKKSPYESSQPSKLQSRIVSKLHTLKEEDEENEVDSLYSRKPTSSNAAPISKEKSLVTPITSYYDNMSIFSEEDLVRNMVYDIFEYKKKLEQDECSNETGLEDDNRTQD